MPVPLEPVYDNLYRYCEERDFAGADPFDGLNSEVFRSLSFLNVRPVRLAWLQMVKRSPFDLRRLLRIRDGVNPKGLALFALAELSRLRATGETGHAENAGQLLQRLLDTQIVGTTPGGEATAAFGYNFDWQSRSFFAPVGTPAVVPTAFACRALIEGYDAFRDPAYLETADAICRFITNALARPVENVDEICFSYTPLDNGIVYNASLLAGECLASVGRLAGSDEHLRTAARSAEFVLNRQRADGAWVYGGAASQQWVDNFHTAYILVSLRRIAEAVPETQAKISAAIAKGIDYWMANFFLDDGTPKYYDSALYPIDIHSAGVALSAMGELAGMDERLLPAAQRVAEWTIANMLDSEGCFYYQRRRGRIIKTPFMRWGQAWMAYGIARMLEAEGNR